MLEQVSCDSKVFIDININKTVVDINLRFLID